MCLVREFDSVYLSDGVSNHTALIYSVDRDEQEIRLFDPWAFESFLLPGRNIIGATATAVMVNDRPILVLSFDDFLASATSHRRLRFCRQRKSWAFPRRS